MTLLESYALDISQMLHRACEEEKKGRIEETLRLLEEVKRLHQLCWSDVWHQYHTSGTIKGKGE